MLLDGCDRAIASFRLPGNTADVRALVPVVRWPQVAVSPQLGARIASPAATRWPTGPVLGQSVIEIDHRINASSRWRSEEHQVSFA